MSFHQELIASLRQALAVRPDNFHLHRHLADLLKAGGALDEAVASYCQALRLQPHHSGVKLSLAQCFFAQQKFSAALVLLEDLLSAPEISVETHLLYAHLMARRRDHGQATHHYLCARALQPGLQDHDLESRIPFFEPPDPWDAH